MIPYILHAGLILTGCLAFYKILLQKETFFRLNRWMLVACLVLSFSLPLIQVPQQWSFRKAEITLTLPASNEQLVDNSPSATEAPLFPVTPIEPETKKQTVSLSQVFTWLSWFYWFGVAVFAINFLLQITTLLYRAYTRPVIKDGRFRIVELAGDKAPCSFGNNIFINPEKYDWDIYNQILLHEKIHVRQGHSADIVLAELALIFQWFNPFAWLYRKELENNLEFLTDEQLLHHREIEKTSYQMSLLKVSAPHFPLSLTTNYNQSLLKKRLAMMNVKKSSVRTTWKYFFLFPLMLLFISLLNEPMAVAQPMIHAKKVITKDDHFGLSLEGAWFATIKENKISIQFKNDDDDGSTNSHSFELSEFKDLPRDKSGTFTLTREAGTMQFTGKFEGDQGMGRYKFMVDKSYADAMEKEGISLSEDKDQIVFFLVNIKRSYVKMLKDNGYTDIKKGDLIPLAALKIDSDYIQSFKKNGFDKLTLHDYIPLKALKVTSEYVEDIRKAGYPNVTAQQLITFKSQGIDGKFIADMRSAARTEKKTGADGKQNKEKNDNRNNNTDSRRHDNDNDEHGISANSLVAIKALHIDAEYIHSLSKAGYADLSDHQLISLKSLAITSDYIQNLHSAGLKDIPVNDLVAMKAQNVTPEYLTAFQSVGWDNISIREALSLKSLGVTTAFIKGFHDAGFKDITVNQAVSLKAQGFTAALAKEYMSLGLNDVSLNQIISAKATGTTPSFIASMKEKGHNLKSLSKYIQLKTIVE
jgi:hypothetical protein